MKNELNKCRPCSQHRSSEQVNARRSEQQHEEHRYYRYRCRVVLFDVLYTFALARRSNAYKDARELASSTVDEIKR